VGAGRVHEYRCGQPPINRGPRSRSGSRDREHLNSHHNRKTKTRSHSLDRRPQARGQDYTKHPPSASRSRSQSRNGRFRNRRQEPRTHGYRQVWPDRRSQERSRSRSRSFSSWTDDRQYRDIYSGSCAELRRVAGSTCDTGEISPEVLENTAKSAQYLRRTDGYRDGDIQVIEPGGAVSIDGRVTTMAEEAVRDVAPISRQNQDFQDGLRKLALQFDIGDTASQNSIEPLEEYSCGPSGSKREREVQEPSGRKLQKVVVSRTSDGRSSTRESPAVEWAQGKLSVQGIAGRTPNSDRLSIRDFFKPRHQSGESVNLSTLDR
jgi:hypothetical protein